MRRIRSSGSVKAISLNRDEVLRRLAQISREALAAFPEAVEVRLIGSLASGTHTGTSDIDLVILLDRSPENPLEALRPYYLFFSKRLDVGVDILIGGPEPVAGMERALADSVLLASRRAEAP
ncbi:MAG: nucleotidyltransferase domain-containing protein [Deltaproteobacteria bacterium]|nr:nucleotidyltransferase domain-containing protein [Deltaproteobacteria bacterium]